MAAPPSPPLQAPLSPPPAGAAPLPTVAGVCGWPIHHSLSPLLHTYWLRGMGLAGAYVPFLVRPDRAVAAFRSLPRTSIAGVNVTLPLKAQALASADRASPEAKRLGAANLLYRDRGELVAHNTDPEGFLAPLLEQMDSDRLRRSSAVVFGAGGAARAVVGALSGIGVPDIRVCARRAAPARDLAARFALPSLHTYPWERRQEALGGAALVVNATSAGLKGRAPLDVRLGRSGVEPGALAYDLVYTPRLTPFLREAREAGLATLDGLPMLVEQARPSFARLFGQRPPAALDPLPLLERELSRG